MNRGNQDETGSRGPSHNRFPVMSNLTTESEDGMTALYRRFDPITGARIETASHG